VPLVLLHDAYFLVAFAAYAQVYAFLPSPRSAISGAVVLTLLMAALTAATGDSGLNSLTVVLAVLSVAVGSGLALFIDAIIRESRQRHQLIAELEAARTELAGAEHQAGVLEERQRLAREIHDTLAQGFTSIVVLLEAAEAATGPGPHPAQRYLDQARRTARESLGEARSFVWALQPQALETATLPEALGRLTERLSEETGVTARATVTGTRHPLAPDTEAALLRTAQEGLANIRKHAQAKDVVLTLSYTADGVVLDIRDDGRGFDPAAIGERRDGTGLGLRGMRARLAEAGGTLTVESAPGEGTTLVVELPAPKEPGPARQP
jgi:signal transduction histidine kinase